MRNKCSILFLSSICMIMFHACTSSFKNLNLGESLVKNIDTTFILEYYLITVEDIKEERHYLLSIKNTNDSCYNLPQIKEGNIYRFDLQLQKPPVKAWLRMIRSANTSVYIADSLFWIDGYIVVPVYFSPNLCGLRLRK